MTTPTTVMLLTAAVAAGIFAAAAYLGVELSRAIVRSAPGAASRPTHPEPPLLGFIIISAVIGAAIGSSGDGWVGIVLQAAICLSLVGCWHGAVCYGRMSDYFTLVPLGAIVLAAFAEANWPLLVGVVVPFIPFAAMAFVSKGKGMGWDDAKLAALGGGMLGTADALLAYATACVLAVAVAWMRKRTGEPIVFGPYVIAMIGLSLVHRFV